MPRGMDERFEDPSDSAKEENAGSKEESTETSTELEAESRDTGAAAEQRSEQQRTASTTDEVEETEDEPLNIREDWDSATIYVEPEQSEDIEITFTRLKKQLKREDITLEKNKHFYRGVFEVAFGDHRKETKEKIRELAKQESNH